MRDVTNGKKDFKKEFPLSGELLGQILDHNRTGIGLIGMEGEILLTNDLFDELTGFEKDEILGMDIREVVPDHKTVENADPIEDLIGEKVSSFTKEIEFHNQKGKTFWAHLSFSLIPGDKDGPNYIITRIEDISEMKRKELALREEKKVADFYLDLLSHDIGNIHQGISSWAQIGLIDMDDKDRVHLSLDNVSNLVMRSKNLVKNVILLSKIIDEETDPATVQISPILKQTISLIKTSYSDQDIDITVNIPDEDLRIRSEPDIMYAFHNIIENGIQVQKDKRPVMDIQGKIVDKIKYRILVIEFNDEGPGMTDKMKRDVFKRFQSTWERNHTGTGLVLVNALVTKYGGNVWIEDKVKGDPSQGTRVVMELPIQD